MVQILSKQNALQHSFLLKLLSNNCYDFKTLEWIKKRNLILGLIQENSIENSVQTVYFIYTKLLVHATLLLTYSKDHILSRIL